MNDREDFLKDLGVMYRQQRRGALKFIQPFISALSDDIYHDAEDVLHHAVECIIDRFDRGILTSLTQTAFFMNVRWACGDWNKYVRIRKELTPAQTYLTGDSEEDSFELEVSKEEVDWLVNKYLETSSRDYVECIQKWMFPHLNARQQAVLMFRFDNQTNYEIAEALNVSVATIERDRQKIRDVFYVYWDHYLMPTGEFV